MQSINANAIKLDINESSKKEFRVLPAGTFTTYDGRTDASGGWKANQYRLAEQLSQREDYVLIDYDHDSVVNVMSHGLPPAAGWVKRFEARDDGLWAVDVEWTPKAAKMIDDLEARYISPAFLLDVETFEVTSLDSIGLVNKPAIKGLTRLAKQESPKPKEDIMTQPTKLTVVDVTPTVTEPVIASVTPTVTEPLETPAELSEMDKVLAAIDELKTALSLVTTKLDSITPVTTTVGSTEAVQTFSIEQQAVTLTSTTKSNELTAEQIRICKVMGLTEDEFRKVNKI